MVVVAYRRALHIGARLGLGPRTDRCQRLLSRAGNGAREQAISIDLGNLDMADRHVCDAGRAVYRT